MDIKVYNKISECVLNNIERFHIVLCKKVRHKIFMETHIFICKW